MKIDSLSPSLITKDINMALSGDEKNENSGFKETLKNSIDNVNQLLSQADKASTDVAMGKSENLHEAMVAFEKADTALRFLVQVRNKALDAYNEIMRMQV
jgi:flagellar hook-basal body complex protein FliE